MPAPAGNGNRTAAARKPEEKKLKVKDGVERAEMLFRQLSDFTE